MKPSFLYIFTFDSWHVSTRRCLPRTSSVRQYLHTSSLASPRFLYSGRTSRPNSMIFNPFGSCVPASIKNSSRKARSLVAIPFRNPAIFPVTRSIATKKRSGAAFIRSIMCCFEQASFGGKHAASTAAASSASSCLIYRNSNRSMTSSSAIFISCRSSLALARPFSVRYTYL